LKIQSLPDKLMRHFVLSTSPGERRSSPRQGTIFMLIPQNEYHRILEQMPIVCVDIAIFNHKSEVLLVKRRNEPAKNRWWLPGGRVLKGEPRRAAAARKLQEECGLQVEFMAELFTSETIFDDGPEGIPIHSVNTVYFTMIREAQITLDVQSSDFRWQPTHIWLQDDLHPYVAQALRESSRLLVQV
jgi:colanic acid biosynthesis protein WcaH